MKIIEVRTQIEFEAALKVPDSLIDLIEGIYRLVTTGTESPYLRVGAGAKFSVVAWGSSQPHVEAWGSSQPHVVAWGSSQPHVVARESSQPHVEARESSQPHVVAWESSQPHVVARESSQPHVEAWGSSHTEFVASGYVQASLFGLIVGKVSANVSVLMRGNAPKVDGGHQVRFHINTPEQWCEYYGVEVVEGIATVFKAVDDKFNSGRGFSYLPGTSPEAPDWDGDTRECGGGLHFSPSPKAALEFFPGAKRFCACKVKLADMRSPHDTDTYPQKIKASRICESIWEVDRNGNPVGAVVESATD